MRGTESGKETNPTRVCTVSTEPDAGLELRDREIVTWLKLDT